jgi:Rieske Fe-S protein
MGENLLSRRAFIRTSVKLAVAGAIIPGALSQLLPAIAPDALGGGGPGPIIRRDPLTKAKIPITIADLTGPPPVVVTAEWNYLPAVIYKVRTDVLKGSAQYHKYNTAQHAQPHPTDGDLAIMAYDGKCKHLGCTVGFNKGLGAAKPEVGKEDYDGDGLPDGRILCPCHQGQYDLHDLAKNVPGTPPPAPLNVIEFDVADYAGDSGRAIPAASMAIIGSTLLEQNAYRDAAGKGTPPAQDAEGKPFDLVKFAIRKAGWLG